MQWILDIYRGENFGERGRILGIFDGHSDLLTDVTRRRLAGERTVLENYHLSRLRQGDIEGIVLAIWADPSKGESYWERTGSILTCVQEEFQECPWLSVVRTSAEAKSARERGQIYAFLGVEGMAAIGHNLQGIDAYADIGVRAGMLTWNEENLLATGAGGDPYSGLTALGKQAVKRMQERNILVDVSHLNDGGFWDVMRQADGVVIASHSNCRALCDVRRNLADDQLRAIRDTGGIVGVNAYHGFVHTDTRLQNAEVLAKHAAHMAEVMGTEHVACGFDFCEFLGPGNEGAEGMESCAHTRNFFYWLEQFGMNETERRMIERENLMRVLQ